MKVSVIECHYFELSTCEVLCYKEVWAIKIREYVLYPAGSFGAVFIRLDCTFGRFSCVIDVDAICSLWFYIAI